MPSEGDDAAGRSPADAFELVAHETRLGIVEALNEADGPESFSDLRERVGVADSGEFNYHLGRLVGRFVRDGEAGYRLTPAGERLVGAVLSGAYTGEFDEVTTAVDGACSRCGGDLVARSEPERVRITCTGCGFDQTAPAVPAGALDGRPDEAVPGVVDGWLKRNDFSAAVGLCPNCDGGVARTFALPGEPAAPDWFEGELAAAVVVTRCGRCEHAWHAVPPYAVLTHPAVVAFHHEHGVDVRSTPPWALDWAHGGAATLESEAPFRVAVPVALDGAEQTFVFDRDVALVEER